MIIRTIVSIITLLVIGVGTFLFMRFAINDARAVRDQSCEKFGNISVTNMPSRCYKYFTGEEK